MSIRITAVLLSITIILLQLIFQPVEGGCPCQWTEWNDRDDPTVTGDFEDTQHFGSPCGSDREIQGAECRIKGQSVTFQNREIFRGYQLDLPCDVRGLRCLNIDQRLPITECADFEIRFYCGNT